MPEDTTAILNAMLDQVRSAFQGVLTLDPQEAAIRAGLSILVLLGAALLMTLIRLGLRAIVARLTPKEDAQNGKSVRRQKVGGAALSVVRFAVLIAAIYFVLRIWGFDFGLLTTGALGALVAGAGRAVLIIFIAIAATEVSGFGIKRSFLRAARHTANVRQAAQIRTLIPVLSGVATTAIVVIASMMLLSQIGVDVGPLIAGAGIVGLAVGFGAQTIVKDFLTGLFLIMEDAVSVGDIIRIGDSGGLVEDMSLRTIKFRDFDGTLHIYPYGEAQVLHNLTKTFSYYVFDLSISYSSDILQALEVMRAVGEDLRKDPQFAGMILEPIEVVGVDQLADSGVVLKARIKTAPIKQWSVGREYLKRIKIAFDEAGVEIPFPHLKLVPPDAPIPVDELTRRDAAE